MNCHIIQIDKGNGKFRTIYVPSPELRTQLRKVFRELRELMLSVCDYRLCHGFMPGRSPCTNAAYHGGYRYTLSMDLESFFDSVQERHLQLVPRHILDVCLIDGVPRQGLSTSPMLANIAAAPMDRLLRYLAPRYTRYADDLTFSGDDLPQLYRAREAVQELAAAQGFAINQRKTRLQGLRAGRRIVTGLAVDDVVHQTRKNRRRYRAAKHQQHASQCRGLEQWYQQPRPMCPICWKRMQHGGGLEWHIIHHFTWSQHTTNPAPQIAHNVSHRPETCYERYLTQLLADAPQIGGISDYADFYQQVRQDYVTNQMEQL